MLIQTSNINRKYKHNTKAFQSPKKSSSQSSNPFFSLSSIKVTGTTTSHLELDASSVSGISLDLDSFFSMEDKNSISSFSVVLMEFSSKDGLPIFLRLTVALSL
jgi:hypothetical protein